MKIKNHMKKQINFDQIVSDVYLILFILKLFSIAILLE